MRGRASIACLLLAVVTGCTDTGPAFHFEVYLELTPEVTSVVADGSVITLQQQQQGVRAVRVDRFYADYQAGKKAAPIVIETYAGSSLLHHGTSAVGNCERDCPTWGGGNCPTAATITEEIVTPPAATDFGVRDYIGLDCSDAMFTIVGPPVP